MRLLLALLVSVSGFAQYTTQVKNIQTIVPWHTCGSTCGNSPGNKNPTYGSQTVETGTTLSGRALKFAVWGNYSYGNYFWNLKTYSPMPMVQQKTEFDVYIPSNYVGFSHGIEFHVQQLKSNYVYDMAIQMNFAGKQWRTFVYDASASAGNGKWLNTGVPLSTLSAGWHHVAAEFSMDQTAHTLTLIDVQLDGKVTAVNLTHLASLHVGKDYTTYAAFQLDMDSKPHPYDVIVDNFTLSYK